MPGALWALGFVIFVLASALSTSGAAAGICEDIAQISRDDSAPRVEGKYFNRPYGYMIEIPRGLTGYTSHSPGPQHGFIVFLPSDPRAYVWVDGSANSLLFDSLERLVEHELDRFGAGDGKLVSVEKRETLLGGLPAYRLVVNYRCQEELLVVDEIVSIDSQRQIVYVLALASPAEGHSRHKKSLDMMAETMRFIRRE